jgi:zinc transport system substrate-binding protein
VIEPYPMNRKQKILIATILTTLTISLVAITFLASTLKSDKLSIVATFYPLAFLSQEIGGDQVQVTQLVPDNTEIHSWEPSASHIAATEEADIIVYNGGGADHWMEDDILPSLSASDKRIVVDSTDGLTLIANQDQDEGEEHGEFDPHTWLSPYMNKLQAEKIYEAFVQADPEHESYYTQRWETLEAELTQLDTEYTQGLANINKTTIFVTHEAFGYVATRYGFEQHGVIGLSADEQPSATTIANLVDEMEQYEIYVVYVDPVYSDEYAQTIKSEVQVQTGQTVTILELYLMLGQTNDLDFLEQMQANLANLEIGLEAS